MSSERPNIDFLAGGGEMGALTRAYDWASSPLGSPENWPQSLRVTVRLLLNTGHPMFIWWGPELIQFYNDAYRHTMGSERHSSALGQRGRDQRNLERQPDQALAAAPRPISATPDSSTVASSSVTIPS